MGLLIDPHLCLFLASMDQTNGKLILFFSSVACIATIIDVNLTIFYLFLFLFATVGGKTNSTN